MPFPSPGVQVQPGRQGVCSGRSPLQRLLPLPEPPHRFPPAPPPPPPPTSAAPPSAASLHAPGNAPPGRSHGAVHATRAVQPVPDAADAARGFHPAAAVCARGRGAGAAHDAGPAGDAAATGTATGERGSILSCLFFYLRGFYRLVAALLLRSCVSL
jgi:hypothetical protein